MNLRDVNWRRALYLGALLGGIMWGAIAVGAHQGKGDSIFEVTAGLWVVMLASTLTMLLAGVVLAVLKRSTVGLALVIAPLSGWLSLGWLVVQVLGSGG